MPAIMCPFSCSHMHIPIVVAKPQEKTTAATVSDERKDVFKRSHGATHRIQERDGNCAIFQCARLVSQVRNNKSCTYMVQIKRTLQLDILL